MLLVHTPLSCPTYCMLYVAGAHAPLLFDLLYVVCRWCARLRQLLVKAARHEAEVVLDADRARHSELGARSSKQAHACMQKPKPTTSTAVASAVEYLA